jgi:hypothetical protein
LKSIVSIGIDRNRASGRHQFFRRNATRPERPNSLSCLGSSLLSLRISHPPYFLPRRLSSAACSSSCLTLYWTPATFSTSLGTNRRLHLARSLAASLSTVPYNQRSPCFLSTTPLSCFAPSLVTDPAGSGEQTTSSLFLYVCGTRLP